MNLKCPNCHTIFKVDENHYTALLTQVRTKEFEAEVKRRMSELAEAQKTKNEIALARAETKLEKSLAVKDSEINSLKAEIEKFKSLVENYDSIKKADLASASAQSSQRMAELAAAKDKEIAELRNRLSKSEAQFKLDLSNERNSLHEQFHAKEQKITELTSKLESQETAARNRELELQKNHDLLMKAKEEEIERYKDMKSRLSTKMLGESLEQHCQTAFDQARSQGLFADAYFEKDNDASSGTKGDFIFRDYINGEECISIMFEMKHEADGTAKKHKNLDFFAKLDKDRNNKGCEYAVLVTTLEADNEFYNNGIVDVSYRYPKMFVVRPQFFMPIISLLSKASRRGAATIISLRSELESAKAQSIDVTNFEARRDKFASEFIKYVNASKKKHDDAMDAIDTAIANAEKQINALRKIKSLFDTSSQKLIKAGEVIENDFTIKKLVYGNPTMRAKFDKARQHRQAGEGSDDCISE